MVREYVFLNAFRALAAFWVLLTHCMIWGGWYGLPIPTGKMAVDLFMVISGYLMAANAFQRREREPLNLPHNQFRFWLRRFFRIAPAYYLSLFLAVAAGSYFLAGYEELRNISPHQWLQESVVYDPARIEYTPGNILLHLSFLFGLGPEASFSTFLPDWSLSLEMQFYLAFPLLFILMSRHGYLKAGAVIGFVSVIAGLWISKTLHYYEPSLLFLKLQYFVVGMLVFHVSTIEERGWERWAVVGCAITLATLEFGYGKELFVLPLLVLCMLLFDSMERKGRFPSWLWTAINCRFVHFASQTSYGVYLFHGFFISMVGLILANQSLSVYAPLQRTLSMLVFVTIASYMTGYLVYRWIEIPGIAIGKQVIDRFVPARGR